MDNQEMRQKLKDFGIDIIPRSNEDMIDLYNRTFMNETMQVGIPTDQANIFTYVGSGDTPPQVTNFMGKQVFLRGKPVKVTDPDVLKKIVNSPCFVRGEGDEEKMLKSDKAAADFSAARKAEDIITQNNIERRNNA